MVNLLDWRRWFYPRKETDKSPHFTKKRDLFLAFAIVSLPFLAIALILIGFVFDPSQRQKPDLSAAILPDLPVVYNDTADAYYTSIRPGSFLLVGSWASTVAEFVVAPFMVIFSYAVAWEILRASAKDGTKSDIRPPFLSDILKGAHGMSTSKQRTLHSNQRDCREQFPS